MHWLEFLCHLALALTIFGGFWWLLEKGNQWIDRQIDEKDIRQGRTLTEEDFKIFDEDAPIFMWPLKEDDSGHR